MIDDIYDTVLYNFDVFVFHIVFAQFGLGGGRESCCEESASFVFRKFDIWIASVGLWLTKIHSSAYNNQSGAIISTKHTAYRLETCLFSKMCHRLTLFKHFPISSSSTAQTKTKSEVTICLFVGYFLGGDINILVGEWLF